MKKLVIDIETVGTPWGELDSYVREYLIKGMSEAEAEEEKRRGALSPFTGRIVAIAVVNAETGKSCALFEVPGQSEVVTKRDGNRTLISGSEKQILEKFWEYLDKGSRVISFNGRQFDGPFLMIRSAIHGVMPKHDLVSNRWRFHPNCDLRDVLNFNGAIGSRRMRFNLDLACKSFGIVSPKQEGKDGRAVETMYRAGRYDDIALYCLEDVRATCELYLKLEKTLLTLETTFREGEEHLGRLRKPEPETLIPTSESAFLESVAQTSLELTASLERIEVAAGESDGVMTTRQQALVLEKLVAQPEREEDLPGL
jgi:hypothetical protein